ncbi:MAG: hypothetical protein JNN15_04130 [Blastocatellia bacterium]|nr:hypothetical protein [Blastocatellia bacterium]
MLKRNRIYLVLVMMSVFALSGGHISYGNNQIFSKTANVIGQLLQVNGISAEISSLTQSANNGIRRIADRLMSGVQMKALASEDQKKTEKPQEDLIEENNASPSSIKACKSTTTLKKSKGFKV